MQSRSSGHVRAAPQQERSERRLAQFLQVADELFAELGFEATTMQAIADRAGSSIGALYNYFPDKHSVATTLLIQYAEEGRARLQTMQEESKHLSGARFVETIVNHMVEWGRERPAWLRLLAEPIRLQSDSVRRAIAEAVRSRNPSLSEERAMLAASVVVYSIKGVMPLYQETPAESREMVLVELRKMLTTYIIKSTLRDGK
jgi:AcrR family transcriptional regulator